MAGLAYEEEDDEDDVLPYEKGMQGIQECKEGSEGEEEDDGAWACGPRDGR